MSKWSSEYRDERWLSKREQILERDGYVCQSCGESKDVCLNVHHYHYIKGLKVWEYDNDMLITLCKDCHERRHALNNKMLIKFFSMSIKEIESASIICERGYKYLENIANVISNKKHLELVCAIDKILEGCE